MGNGASSKISSDFCSIDNFKKLEKLSRSGYFQDDYEQYKALITKAIKLDAIDLLEVLVTAGNTKMLKPLHLACALGKIESVELLCSAGQSTYLKDAFGRTPLHLCSLTLSNEGALCATFMILRGKKAISMFDRDGLTPLHSAAAANNVQVLRVILDYCLDVSILSRSGKTALSLAQEAGCTESVKLLQDRSDQGRKSGSKSHSTKKSSAVDQERIMQIWEKFFENAFKSSGGNWAEECEEQPEQEAESYQQCRSDIHSQKHIVEKKKLANTFDSKRDDDVWSESAPSEQYDWHHPRLSAASAAVWFDWVVCYDHDPVDGDCGGYYALHQVTGETRWIEEHMLRVSDELYTTGGDAVRLKWAGSADYGGAERNGRSRSSVAIATSDRMMRKPLPCSLLEAVSDGWCSYYDPVQNACWWLSAPTLCVEAALPLGLTERAENLLPLGLGPCSTEGEEWVHCDQRCALSWVLVVVAADESESEEEEERQTVGSDIYDESADRDIDNDYQSTKISARSVAKKVVDRWEYEQQQEEDRAESIGGLQYYLNRITGETSWQAPPNWTAVTAQWNGGCEDGEIEWVQCCGERSSSNLFWFNVRTGESVWVEE